MSSGILTDASVSDFSPWEDSPWQNAADTTEDILTRVSDESCEAAWEACERTLIQAGQSLSSSDDEGRPNACAIRNALGWLAFLRERAPQLPPSNIVEEPAGGIVMDRRDTMADGTVFVQELTFYNSGKMELMTMRDGKVIELEEIVAIPPRGKKGIPVNQS